MGFLQILFWFKKNILAIVLILLFLAMFYLANRTIKVEKENEEYKRIEQETKIFHEENIVKLKETLKIRDNAKKIDYNDNGNLDDDFLLKSLE
jgi:uncharacterized membrane protein YhiD involved in acid resistance